MTTPRQIQVKPHVHASSTMTVDTMLRLYLLALGLQTVGAAFPGTTQCEGWCNKIVHCSNPVCSACQMCGEAVACTPISKDDLHHESCEGWCKAENKGPHCNACACRRCSFCGKPKITSAVGITGVDQPVECKKTSREDFAYEACSNWCKAEYKSTHCEVCACKACGFCGAKGPGDSSSDHPVTAGSKASEMQVGTAGKACASASRDDSSVETCKSYCKKDHAAAHCERCDCKACGFCSAGEVRGGCGCLPVGGERVCVVQRTTVAAREGSVLGVWDCSRSCHACITMR